MRVAAAVVGWCVLLVVLLAGCGAGRAGREAHVGDAGRCPNGLGSPASGNGVGPIQFVGVRDGWAVVAGRVIATRDGGSSWQVRYRTTPDDLYAVDFVNPTDGWVLGRNTFLATTDGSRQWHALPDRCSRIVEIDFISPTRGFAVAGAMNAVRSTTAKVVESTDTAGRSWQVLATPRWPQSICFSNRLDGWLGAGGRIYRTTTGGHAWTLSLSWPPNAAATDTDGSASVACEPGNAAWGELIADGGEMSQEPHIGYHTFGHAWTPIFSEAYFPTGLHVPPSPEPGGYAGPFAAISRSAAVYTDACEACGAGTSPLVLAADGGRVLDRPGVIGDITYASGVNFATTEQGWAVGTLWTDTKQHGSEPGPMRVVHTTNGGRTWQVQYSTQPR